MPVDMTPRQKPSYLSGVIICPGEKVGQQLLANSVAILILALRASQSI